MINVRRKTDTRNLNDFKADTGDISLGFTLPTETGEEDFVVLIHEVQATVIGDCSRAQVRITNLIERSIPPYPTRHFPKVAR